MRALWYLNPDRVFVEVLRTGRLRYKVTTGGQQQIVTDTAMLHIVGPMSDDGYTGRSVIGTFRETLGLGLALERYGGEFFANAATPRGVLQAKGRISDPARERLQASLTETHGSRGRRHRTLVLEEGLEWPPIGISHEDSQLLEARRLGTEEVARIFGVPPHMIGGDVKGSMTYANAETEALRLLKHTLGPWLARIAGAVNHACVSPLERRQMYAEFLPDALLATDHGRPLQRVKDGLGGRLPHDRRGAPQGESAGAARAGADHRMMTTMQKPSTFEWASPFRVECLRCGTWYTTRELGARCPACGFRETAS